MSFDRYILIQRGAWALWSAMLFLVLLVATAMLLAEPRWAGVLEREVLVGLRSSLYLCSLLLFLFLGGLRARLLQSWCPVQPVPDDKAAIGPGYLKVMVVTLLMPLMIGLAGAMLYQVGDTIHSLYIFSGLSVFGMILYRPKMDEIASAEMA